MHAQSSDAVTLGLSLRKRFRGSSRHQKLGKGLLITIQTIVGHTLFSCTVGDLGASAGLGYQDVSLDSWQVLEGMVAVVRRTGHSSFYVEKGMGAMGKTPKQMGVGSEFRVHGGGEWFGFFAFETSVVVAGGVWRVICGVWLVSNADIWFFLEAFPVWLDVSFHFMCLFAFEIENPSRTRHVVL